MDKKTIVNQLNNKIASPNHAVIFKDDDGEVLLHRLVELSESGGVFYIPDIDNSYLVRKDPQRLMDLITSKITIYAQLSVDEWLGNT